MSAFLILYHQHKKELTIAYLRAFDDQRTASTQVRVGFEQDFFFLIELEIQTVTGVVFAAGIAVQREVFARSEPIFFSGLERSVRLTDQLELIVAEQILQRLLELCEFGGNRRRLRNVLRNDESAPNGVGR